MMTRGDMTVDCKIVDVSLHSPPLVTAKGFRIVAGFTILHWPLRIKNCALVSAPNDTWLIWTPDPVVKINRAGGREVVQAALDAIEEAKARLM